MPLKITFLTTLDRNVGDEFIREGIRAALDHGRIGYLAFCINKHAADSLHATCAEESICLADKYWDADVVVQAGAPVYWHLAAGRATSVTSEWYPWFWRERVLAGGVRQHPLFLNLGAGSCQPWGDDGAAFLQDAACTSFARAIGRRAALTTVRDPLAARILNALAVPNTSMPCPAFLAAARHAFSPQLGGPIGVNLMPQGGHYQLGEGVDQERWRRSCALLAAQLRSLGPPLFFVAHDLAEEEFLHGFALAGEPVFRATNWRAYLEAYAQCSLVVANRVHAAVCAAGFGVPSIILGSDTRAQIGVDLALPIFQSDHDDSDRIFSQANRLWTIRQEESARLLSLRQAALNQLTEALVPHLTIRPHRR
jgi:hypothetical protein